MTNKNAFRGTLHLDASKHPDINHLLVNPLNYYSQTPGKLRTAHAVLLSGGGFDTLACLVGWLAIAHDAVWDGQTMPSVAGMYIEYGQSVAPAEKLYAYRQWHFLNTALDQLNRWLPAEGPFVVEWTPPDSITETDRWSGWYAVHDTALAGFIADTDHPIGWNHIVPGEPLPDHSNVASRNTRFLQTAQLYAQQYGWDTVIFGAQGSGPDVSPRYLNAVHQTLFHGGGDKPFSIFAPQTGMLKSVGMGAIGLAGLHPIAPYLGFSCQSHNGFVRDPYPFNIAVHCGVCFRCGINKLNYNRAWLPYNLIDLPPETVATRTQKGTA